MNGHSEQQVSGAKRLRQLLSDPSKTVVAPGVYDGLTARLSLAQGFDCLYMTGAGTSMSRLGMADLGLTTFTDMHANAAMIASIDLSVPVIADADTGYGGPINVANTVRAYARSGVAGMHIEDQVQEKRCGHLSGKLLVSREVYYNRLRAACKARDESGSGIVIIARSDAAAGKDVDGNGGFDEAVARLTKAAEIGVDALFFEGTYLTLTQKKGQGLFEPVPRFRLAPGAGIHTYTIQSEEQCKEVIERLPKIPVLLNMVPGGRTPIITNERANEIGFRLVIWPTLALEAVVPAVEKALQSLKKTGKTPEDQSMGPGALFEVCGLRDLMAFDESVGGKAYSGS